MGKRLLAVLAAVFCLSAPFLHAEEDSDLNRPLPIDLKARDDVLYRHKLSAGWLMVRPQGESKVLRLRVPDALLPSAQSFDAAVSTRLADVDTPGLFYTYSITDHWGIEVFGGVPPDVELVGKGVINAPVTVIKLPPLPIVGSLPGLGGELQAGGLTQLLDAGDPAVNPLATAKAWVPTVITTYTFFGRNALIRPYVGLGLTYGFLTDPEVNPNAVAKLNEKGPLLALITNNPRADRVTAEAEADPFFSAVATLGLNINLTRQLGILASATYVPAETTLHLRIKDRDEKIVATADTDIKIDPFIFFVALSYRFNL